MRDIEWGSYYWAEGNPKNSNRKHHFLQRALGGGRRRGAVCGGRVHLPAVPQQALRPARRVQDVRPAPRLDPAPGAVLPPPLPGRAVHRAPACHSGQPGRARQLLRMLRTVWQGETILYFPAVFPSLQLTSNSCLKSICPFFFLCLSCSSDYLVHCVLALNKNNEQGRWIPLPIFGLSSLLAQDSGYQCDKCRRMFCFNCDVYIHDVLFNCPGCVH